MSHRKTSKPGITITPSKQHQSNLTPTARTPTKSPISNTKCNHQSNQKQNVSYGQLQIVLENLQNIKQKASNQVKLLNQENSSLRQEICQLKNVIQDLRSQVIQKDQDIRKYQDQWRETERVKDMQIRQKQLDLRQKDRLIATLKRQQESSHKIEEEYRQLKQKWRWAFTILSGDPSRAQQAVYKIKSQNLTIWQLLQKQISISSLFQLSKQKIQSLTHQLVTVRQQYKHSTQMLDKSLNQLNTVTVKMTSLEEKVKEYSQFLVQTKEEQLLLEKKIEQGNTDRQTLQTTIVNLQHTISTLNQQISMLKQIQTQKDTHTNYQSLVTQICDQTEDYSQILQRLQYLQRFRNQHFKNIEKIQHLCKLIDS